MASLFQACKSAVRNKQGGTFNIGEYDIDIEMYGQQDIDNEVTFGDSNQDKIVLIANDTITIPSSYTLAPSSPKKSLVFFCNTFVNNGTISMVAKAPNVLPHDYFIIEGTVVGSNKNIIIPAYANNKIARYKITSNSDTRILQGANGNNGTNRNCGSGGTGCCGNNSNVYYGESDTTYIAASGSGYAFGGGAGSGGSFAYYRVSAADVNTTYPMRGGDGATHNTWMFNCGGVGNPVGATYGQNSTVYANYTNNTGCGGRIIIFCTNFTNNGTITVNGTATKNPNPTGIHVSSGGASGAGAVDLFYTSLIKQGTITANGGATYSLTLDSKTVTPGKGGDGSITLTQWSLDKIVKEERKKFSRNNWIYLMDNYSQRLKDEVI